MIAQLSPADFAAWRDNAVSAAPAHRPVVLDVREPWELQTASVREDGFELMHIPMREVPARIAEMQQSGLISPDQPIACLCHHGMRSMHVGMFLLNQGFEQVTNITGGIDAWSRERDPAVPVY